MGGHLATVAEFSLDGIVGLPDARQAFSAISDWHHGDEASSTSRDRLFLVLGEDLISNGNRDINDVVGHGYSVTSGFSDGSGLAVSFP